MRTGTGLAGVSTLVSDPQGTALVSIANGTNVVSRRYTDPFGNARGAKPTWPGDHAMLDKVLDASGLTQVGARFLDTATGRFVSVDPVLDTSNPQQWNAYAYAGNNPVTFSDPSGLFIPNMHPDGMTDKQWGRASKGEDPGPGMAPAQPSSVANSHYKATTVTPPVKVPVCAPVVVAAPKKHGLAKWWDDHGSTVISFTAGVIVGGGCEFLTAGVGSVGCAALGGMAASAAGDLSDAAIHGTQVSASGLVKDTLIGGAEGAATAGLLKGGGSALKGAARSCSFAGSTPVVLADGSRKDIKDVTAGDRVLATDPETGEQLGEPVVQVFKHQDSYYRVSIGGESLTTTANHPLWSVTDDRFERADQLSVGEQVLGADGRGVAVTASGALATAGWAYNLSVQDI
ncbi:RHS repeat-associated core domain-containing protein [Luteimicrobium xylanilyticum]|uniref:RHS repeat-associated core domain-containing protein n=1 Tax=Luteimicrobium xylanilyticum TaxID=1133546 RepID=UPI0018842CA7|nr:RHS repeat-associated core domain-containing protein [Luteimicrobium xylanilyticum]